MEAQVTGRSAKVGYAGVLVCLLLLGAALSGAARTPERWLLFLKDKGPQTPLAWVQGGGMSRAQLELRWRTATPVDELDIPVSNDYLRQLALAGLRVVRSSRWLNAVLADYTPTEALAQWPTCVVAAFRLDPAPNRSTTVVGMGMAAHRGTNAQAGADNFPTTADYGDHYDAIHQIRVDSLHFRGLRGEGVRVLVLDSGFPTVPTNPGFDSLRRRSGILATYDFVDDEADVYDDDPHGARVFSVLAGERPGQFWGAAPRASYLLGRTENANSERLQEEFNWVAGAEWGSTLGAAVIQSSVSYSTFDLASENHTYADMDGRTTIIAWGATAAAGRGLVVVNSAGNEGNSSWGRICTPCDADSILCVGATDVSGLATSYSGRGPSADRRVKPDVAALGSPAAYLNTAGLVAFGNGTSFSTPLVAGMVTLLRQAHPQAPAQDIIRAVRNSGSRAQNPDSLLGYGVPNGIRADQLLRQYTQRDPAHTGAAAELQVRLGGAEPQVVCRSGRWLQVRLEVLDMQGRRMAVLPEFTTNVVQPLGVNLPAGVYVLRALTPMGVATARYLQP